MTSTLVFYVLPTHTNIMADKRFNLFDECAARCVHLFPQEEECTSSSWRNSKMYTFGSAANSQDANWNKQKWRYNQNKDLSGKWYCQTLKTFGIISSEMKISLFLSWWCFSCLLIQRIGIQYTDQLFSKIIA